MPPPTALDDRGDWPPSGVWVPPPAETPVAGSAAGSDLAMGEPALFSTSGAAGDMDIEGDSDDDVELEAVDDGDGGN